LCREYGWTIDYVIHELPSIQAFALSSCSAWGSGLEPKNGGYIDWAIDREFQKLKEATLTSED